MFANLLSRRIFCISLFLAHVFNIALLAAGIAVAGLVAINETEAKVCVFCALAPACYDLHFSVFG